MSAYAKEFFISSISKKYSYNFTWLGRSIIQNPEDLIRIQEVAFP